MGTEAIRQAPGTASRHSSTGGHRPAPARGRRTGIAGRFLTDASGTTAIEYALLAALISLACVAALGNLSASVTDVLQDLAVALDRAMD